MFPLFFAGFMLVNGAPAPDLNSPERELAQVLEQARRDFEARHAELGLLGAAPLAGREQAKPATEDRIGQRRAQSLDDGQAKAVTAHHRQARRPSR